MMIEDGELTHEATEVLAEILVTWMMFKEKHDYKSLELACCGRSRRLFESLDRYEKFMLGKEHG